MAHQLTGSTIASTFEQLWYRGTTEPGGTTSAAQILTSENDQTDDIGTALYIGTERVGVNTSSPDYLFEIEQSANATAVTELAITNSHQPGTTETGQACALIFNLRHGGGTLLNAGVIKIGKSDDWHPGAGTSDSFMDFYTTNAGTSTFRMRLDTNGQLGVGSSPAYMLHVTREHATNNSAFIENSSDSDTADILWLKSGHAGNPTTGNLFITFSDAGGELDSMQGDGSGGINFTGAADDAYSDRRVKTDIADLTGALAKINALKPRTYNYTSEFLNQNFQSNTIKEWQKKTQDGFIAQELGEVFPDILQPTTHIVQSDDVAYDGKTYNTGDSVEIIKTCWGRRGTLILFANLIKAVQELSAKVTALENA